MKTYSLLSLLRELREQKRQKIPKNNLLEPGGGGTPHMKGVGMLVGNFELNP